MKRAIILIALVAIVVACGGKKAEKSTTEVNLVENYLALKDALVATDATKAQESAVKFLAVNKNENLVASLTVISSSTNVKEQRVAFETLSMQMYDVIKIEGTDVPLFKQYCPMAFDNKGAFWLAAETEINNPYFGSMMLHCGSIQETISN
ncbi:MAG: hypothetical protein ACJAXX_000767 [Roseivirga sp.]|jgi:hypothetical protein